MIRQLKEESRILARRSKELQAKLKKAPKTKYILGQWLFSPSHITNLYAIPRALPGIR